MAYRENKRKRNGIRPKEHNGEGSFKTRIGKNGKKMFYLTFSYLTIDGKKARKTVSGISDVDCYKKRDEFLNSIKLNLPEQIENATIVDLIILSRKENIDTGNCHEQGDSRNQSTQKIFEKYPVANPIGNIPIKDVTSELIEKFKYEIRFKYSESVIKKIFIQLRQAYNLAVKKRIISENPLDDKKLNTLPESEKKTKEIDAYNEKELKRFFEVFENLKLSKNQKDYRPQLFIELATGMRMGEINALTVDCVDLEHDVVIINKTISRGKNYKPFLKNGTKTKKGNREIPITPNVKKYFEEALKKYAPNNQKLLFFDHKNNKVITTQQVNDWTRRICEKNDLRFEGVHMLRHTFATVCARKNMSITILAKILGHEDTKITMKYYITVDNDDKKKALEAVFKN